MLKNLRLIKRLKAPRTDTFTGSTPAEPQATAPVTDVAVEFEADVYVAAKTVVAEGVVALELREAGGGSLPPWQPGAHIDLILGGAPTRQYSLCGDPDDNSVWRLGVLRDPGGRGSSLYIHDTLQPGDLVRVRGPRNHFPLVPSQRHLFIAGGIGITPLLPMISAATAAGSDWRLVYGGRQRASMGFLPELAAYGDRVSVRPQDETGLLNLDEILGQPDAGTAIYCCGPEALLAAVEARCAAWPAKSLHIERFSPKPIAAPIKSEPFEVILEQSGISVTVPPDRSILEAVEEVGVSVLSSCGEGTCGTCETRVLGGLPDHRDSLLDDSTKDAMMICVSRSLTPQLILDL